MTDDTPLILLPGLGADARMFSAIHSGLPQLVTPPWIEPLRGESVAGYARRFAAVIDPGRPCFIGGTSFGGVVAQEVAAVLPHVRACFVIGSTRSDKSKPWRIRILRPITPFTVILPWMSPLLVRLLGSWLRLPTRGVMTQLADADAKFLRWGAQAILKWHPPQFGRDSSVESGTRDRDRHESDRPAPRRPRVTAAISESLVLPSGGTSHPHPPVGSTRCESEIAANSPKGAPPTETSTAGRQ